MLPYLNSLPRLAPTFICNNFWTGCNRLPYFWPVKQSLFNVVPVSSQRHHSLYAFQWQTGLPSVCTSLYRTGLQNKCSKTDLFSNSFRMLSSKPASELSEKGEVVYRGAISGMIKGVKIFSLSTSLIGICLQPMLLFSNQELPTGLKFALGGIINFFVFLNPFIIHYIAKKYVTELRWNKSTGVFTATTWSLFVRRQELQFKAEDVKVPGIPGMFTTLEAKETPLFLDPEAFQESKAYIHLMGFDKPLDWEMPPRRDHPEKEAQKR